MIDGVQAVFVVAAALAALALLVVLALVEVPLKEGGSAPRKDGSVRTPRAVAMSGEAS